MDNTYPTLSPGVRADGTQTPTLDEVREWPATVDVGRGCRALGISRSWGYQLVAQGEFPCKTITIGRRSRVVTASLLALLEGGDGAA